MPAQVKTSRAKKAAPVTAEPSSLNSAPITASMLRENVYKILDEALETGVPVEVIRKGKKLRIVPEKTRSKLSGLKKRKGAIIGDPEDLVHMDWLSEWSELKNDPS